jgi:DNA-binding NarL/FixJ family response regulator
VTEGSSVRAKGHPKSEPHEAPSVTRRLVEEFVRRPPPGSTAARRLEGVTERELEVLRLVARGLSNAEIAGTLFLGESTVKTHVGHILDKRAS